MCIHLHDMLGNSESQNIRTVGAGRDLQRSYGPIPLQSRTPTAGCISRRPGGSWVSPEKENPQPPWAACSSAPSPLLWRSSYSHLCTTSYTSVCGHFPLSCCPSVLKRVWPHPFASSTLDIYRCWSDPLWVIFCQGWTDPGCSAFPHKRGAPGPLSL